MPKVFNLSISSYAGFDPDASHYYGELQWSDGKYQRLQVRHALTQKEATSLNKSDRGARWKKGDLTERFDSKEDLIAFAIKEFEKHASEGDVLLQGQYASGDPKTVLVGPPAFMKRGNYLHKCAKDIDFYEKQPKKMESIYQHWLQLQKEYNLVS